MSKREVEVSEEIARTQMKYPWVYDCTFRDTLFKPDAGSGSFVDFARCEFEAKLEDGRWRHFFITGMISKIDREMDVMKRLSNTLSCAVSRGMITEGSKEYKISEVRAIEVPEDKKKLLMKNRIISILEQHDDAGDEQMIQKILNEGVGAHKMGGD